MAVEVKKFLVKDHKWVVCRQFCSSFRPEKSVRLIPEFYVYQTPVKVTDIIDLERRYGLITEMIGTYL